MKKTLLALCALFFVSWVSAQTSDPNFNITEFKTVSYPKGQIAIIEIANFDSSGFSISAQTTKTGFTFDFEVSGGETSRIDSLVKNLHDLRTRGIEVAPYVGTEVMTVKIILMENCYFARDSCWSANVEQVVPFEIYFNGKKLNFDFAPIQWKALEINFQTAGELFFEQSGWFTTIILPYYTGVTGLSTVIDEYPWYNRYQAEPIDSLTLLCNQIYQLTGQGVKVQEALVSYGYMGEAGVYYGQANIPNACWQIEQWAELNVREGHTTTANFEKYKKILSLQRLALEQEESLLKILERDGITFLVTICSSTSNAEFLHYYLSKKQAKKWWKSLGKRQKKLKD